MPLFAAADASAAFALGPPAYAEADDDLQLALEYRVGSAVSPPIGIASRGSVGLRLPLDEVGVAAAPVV